MSEDPTQTAMIFEPGDALAKARGSNGKKVVAAAAILEFPASFVGG